MTSSFSIPLSPSLRSIGITVLVKSSAGALQLLTFSLDTGRPSLSLSVADNLTPALLPAGEKNPGLTLHSAGVVSPLLIVH